jgi:DNA-binding NtrC family response regulator
MTQLAAQTGAQILIADDNPANLDVLGQLLEGEGYRVLAAPSGEVALRVAGDAHPDLVFLDVMMEGVDGYETCRRLKGLDQMRDVPVIFISARDETQSLVSGFAAGGVDYITKPFHGEEVLTRVATHLKISRLTRELHQRNSELQEANESLRAEMGRRQQAEDALQVADDKLSAMTAREAERWGIDGIVGRSKTLSAILADIRRLQNFSSVNVLITGESGTGKELVARAVHFGSGRAKQPFIAVNCVAVPEDLAESMFFGHVRGAFTGATMDRKGFFELADGGTLFLDEIGDMPVTLQAKLLRVLEDGKIMPLGSTREKKVDVRIVAATNADLHRQIAGGSFRQDLYFRLAQFSVDVPALRERREDIPLLARHFLRLFAQEMKIPVPPIEPEAMAALSACNFPGNVRELKNIIERAMIESGGQTVTVKHLRFTSPPARSGEPSTPPANAESTAAAAPAGDLPLNLEAAENLLIRRALAETNGNIAEAARRLGVNRTRIYRKLGEGTI